MAGTEPNTYELHPIGVVRSTLRSPREAPRQAFEGGPPARLELLPEFRAALDGIADGELEVRALEAVDGTPVVDIKPVMGESDDG